MTVAKEKPEDVKRLDPDERLCVACQNIEHKDGGRACEGCGDWFCDGCVDDELPVDEQNGERLYCADCLETMKEIDEDANWHWRNR